MHLGLVSNIMANGTRWFQQKKNQLNPISSFQDPPTEPGIDSEEQQPKPRHHRSKGKNCKNILAAALRGTIHVVHSALWFMKNRARMVE